MNVDVLQVVMVIMVVHIIMIMVLFTTTKSSKNNDLVNLGKRKKNMANKKNRQLKKQVLLELAASVDDVGKLEELDLLAFPAPRDRLDFRYCEHHEQHHHPLDIRVS